MAEKEIILAQEYRLFLIRLPIYMGKMALTQKSAILGRFSRSLNLVLQQFDEFLQHSASSPGEDDTFADITSENLAEDGALVDIDDALQRERDDMNAIAEGGRGDDDLDSDHIRRIRNKPMSSSISADMVELVLFLIRRRQGTISTESFKRWSLASVLPLY